MNACHELSGISLPEGEEFPDESGVEQPARSRMPSDHDSLKPLRCFVHRTLISRNHSDNQGNGTHCDCHDGTDRYNLTVNILHNRRKAIPDSCGHNGLHRKKHCRRSTDERPIGGIQFFPTQPKLLDHACVPPFYRIRATKKAVSFKHFC